MKGVLRVFLFAAGLACAMPALSQTAAPSPLLGSWAVDVSRLPMPPEQRPKSVTFTYSDAGNGKWTTVVDIVPADGPVIHSVATYSRDGKSAPVQGSPEADIVSVMTPRPDVLVMALSRGGVPGSIRIMAVAPDGKSYVETSTYFAEDGRPVMRTNLFNRIR